jgi:hypothetical protein
MRIILMIVMLCSAVASAETYHVDHTSISTRACANGPDAWWRDGWHVRVTADDVLIGGNSAMKSMSNGTTHWGWFTGGDGVTILLVVSPRPDKERADVKVFMIQRRGAATCVERWIGVGERT